ncbi:hypothetical protein WJX73_010796 [Symbiochloris irregularis]|uniref:Uncharacterized protein n=1 Tax=Symbiochloris irregularis TaxID=706552 RepID=A0AAW1PYU2_9CHLO
MALCSLHSGLSHLHQGRKVNLSCSAPQRSVGLAGCLRPCKPVQREVSAEAFFPAVAALAIDWSSPDTWAGVGVAVAGLAVGIGIPAFYMQLDAKDEERLEELRELNRQTYKETGEYLSEDEIKKIRSPRWTDRRQFEDDD